MRDVTRRARTSAIVLGTMLATLPLTGCSGPPDKAQFVDHALEISTSATTDTDRERIRTIFGCIFDAGIDEGLAEEFMAADEINDDLSRQISPLMVDCMKQSTTSDGG